MDHNPPNSAWPAATALAGGKLRLLCIAALAVVAVLVVCAFWQPDDSLSDNSALLRNCQSARRDLLQAAADLQRSRGAWVTARTEFEDFLAGHFDHHRAAAETLEQRGATASPAGQPTPEPQLIINPAYTEIKSQIAMLSEKRVTLLTRLEVDHPLVQDIDARLADLDSELSAVPELITAAPRPARATTMAAPVAAADSASRLQAFEDAAEHRLAVSSYETARDKYVHAQVTLDATIKAAMRTAERYAASSAHLSQVLTSSARVAQVEPTSIAPIWIVLAAVASAALILGGVAVLMSEGVNPKLWTPQQVEAALEQRVLAVLPASKATAGA